MKSDNMDVSCLKVCGDDWIRIGSTVQIDFSLVDSLTKQPFDLTSYTELTVILPAAPSGQINLTANNGSLSGSVAVIGSPTLGNIRLTVQPAQSSGLLATDEGSIEILVDKGAVRKIAQVIQRVPIEARLFS